MVSLKLPYVSFSHLLQDENEKKLIICKQTILGSVKLVDNPQKCTNTQRNKLVNNGKIPVQ